jgi:hypothetical protein
VDNAFLCELGTKEDLLSRLKGRLTGQPKYAQESIDCGRDFAQF